MGDFFKNIGLGGLFGGGQSIDSTYLNKYTPKQWQEFGASGGTINASGKILADNAYGSDIGFDLNGTNIMTDTSSTGGIMDWASSKDGMFSSGSNLMNAAGLGLGVAGYFQEGDKLKMYEQALQDQLENSELTRSKTADDLITQAGVRASLAGAFGADTSPYTSVANRYSKYQTSSPTSSAGLGTVYNNANASPEMAASRMMLNKNTEPSYAMQLANTKKRREESK